MNEQRVLETLAGLPLGQVAYYESVASTNDIAAEWLKAGEAHASVVIADEQRRGRGRSGRTWFTPPGSALAFSMILQPAKLPNLVEPAMLSGLGALAVCEALEALYHLPTAIKWPNDVLIGEKKTCGVLAEAHWEGNHLQGIVLGIGINIASSSVPPAENLTFPATSVEDAAGNPVDRLQVLHAVLAGVLKWLPKTHSPEFMHAWEARLAFQGAWVRMVQDGQPDLKGQVIGLTIQGQLRLRLENGEERHIQAGEIHLRPLVDS